MMLVCQNGSAWHHSIRLITLAGSRLSASSISRACRRHSWDTVGVFASGPLAAIKLAAIKSRSLWQIASTSGRGGSGARGFVATETPEEGERSSWSCASARDEEEETETPTELEIHPPLPLPPCVSRPFWECPAPSERVSGASRVGLGVFGGSRRAAVACGSGEAV